MSNYFRTIHKPYLDNKDNIDYLEKLIYVTYAKLKLEELIKHKTSLEADIINLLIIFSKIMDADGAFISVRNGNHLYPMTFYNKKTENELRLDDEEQKGERFDYEHWIFYDYYTKRYNHKQLIYPFIPMYNKQNQEYGEVIKLHAHSLNIFVIEEQNAIDNLTPKSRATITFLYKKDNPLTDSEAKFRVNLQESGRLLLLLKNEINKYIIEYMIKDKVFDLWLEKHRNIRKFEKIYSDSNHTFKVVYAEMNEFEHINTNILSSTYRTWYFLTNQTISFFYSDIERNESNGKHYLSIGDTYVIVKDEKEREKNTLGMIFNESYIFILSRLLDEKWNSKDETKDNIIVINGQDIHNYQSIKEQLNKDNLFNVSISMNKHLLRTFIAQCLHNSLAYNNHGHRNWEEFKRIEISITESHIKIEDTFISDISEYSRKKLKREITKFKTTKKCIQALKCNTYSSTTLTTLQGVINYMNQDRILSLCKCKYQCDYGFNENNNFCVTIKYQKNE